MAEWSHVGHRGHRRQPSHVIGGTQVPLEGPAKYWRVHSQDRFQVGAILNGPVHEQERNIGANPDADRNMTSTCHGPIYSKVRRMVVVQRWYGHYIALPFYSHNGNGLAYKENKNEFVTVQDHRSKVKARPQSEHNPLWTEYLKDGVPIYTPETTVHLTYPQARAYDKPCSIEGYLDRSSIKRLVEKYKTFCSTAKC